MPMQISIIIPARDEENNLTDLLIEIDSAFKDENYEVIVVDDGSEDNTITVIRSLMNEHRPWLRLIAHRGGYGKGAALRTGLLGARGNIIALIDGDGENDPLDLKRLVDHLRNSPANINLVNGRRLGRKHSLLKLWASKFANTLRRKVLKDNIQDSASGLKAIRRETFLRLPYFYNWHRYLPALVITDGGEVVEMDVADRPRKAGRSKYRILDRALVGLLDLPAVWWLVRSNYGGVKSEEHHGEGL